MALLCTTYKEASGRRQTKKIEAKTRMLNSTPTYFRLSIKHWNTLIYRLICLFSSIPTYTKGGVHPQFVDRNKQKSFSGSISLMKVSSIQNLKKTQCILLQNPVNKYFFETIQDKIPTQEFKCLFHLLQLLGSM